MSIFFWNYLEDYVLVLEKSGQAPVWSFDLGELTRKGLVLIAGKDQSLESMGTPILHVEDDIAQWVFKDSDSTMVMQETETLARLECKVNKISLIVENNKVSSLMPLDGGEEMSQVTLTPQGEWKWGDYCMRVRPKSDFPCLKFRRQRFVLAHTPIKLGNGMTKDAARLTISVSGVSHEHCQMELQAGRNGFYRCWIEDLNSKNGTFVNRERLRPDNKKLLLQGSEIQLGRALLVYQERYIPALPWLRYALCLTGAVVLITGAALWYYITRPTAEYWVEQARISAAKEWFYDHDVEDGKSLSAMACLEKARKAWRGEKQMRPEIEYLENRVPVWAEIAPKWKECKKALMNLTGFSAQEDLLGIYRFPWNNLPVGESWDWNDNVRKEQKWAKAWHDVMKICRELKVCQDEMEVNFKNKRINKRINSYICFEDVENTTLPELKKMRELYEELLDILTRQEQDLSCQNNLFKNLMDDCEYSKKNTVACHVSIQQLIKEWKNLNSLREDKGKIHERLEKVSQEVELLQENLESLIRQHSREMERIREYIGYENLLESVRQYREFLQLTKRVWDDLASNCKKDDINVKMVELRKQANELARDDTRWEDIRTMNFMLLDDLEELSEYFYLEQTKLMATADMGIKLIRELTDMDGLRGGQWSGTLDCDCLKTGARSDTCRLEKIEGEYNRTVGITLGNALFEPMRVAMNSRENIFTYKPFLKSIEMPVLVSQLKRRLDDLYRFFQYAKSCELFQSGTGVWNELLNPAQNEWNNYGNHLEILIKKRDDMVEKRRVRLMAFVLCKALETSRFDGLPDKMKDGEALKLYKELKMDMNRLYEIYLENGKVAEKDVEILKRLGIDGRPTAEEIVKTMIDQSLPDSNQAIRELVEE